MEFECDTMNVSKCLITNAQSDMLLKYITYYFMLSYLDDKRLCRVNVNTAEQKLLNIVCNAKQSIDSLIRKLQLSQLAKERSMSKDDLSAFNSPFEFFNSSDKSVVPLENYVKESIVLSVNVDYAWEHCIQEENFDVKERHEESETVDVPFASELSVVDATVDVVEIDDSIGEISFENGLCETEELVLKQFALDSPSSVFTNCDVSYSRIFSFKL